MRKYSANNKTANYVMKFTRARIVSFVYHPITKAQIILVYGRYLISIS